MRRRHLLALIILALVVATVALGPLRVWDWLTMRTVERPWIDSLRVSRLWLVDGTVTCSYRVGVWSEPEQDSYPLDVRIQGYHPIGQPAVQAYTPLEGSGYLRAWSVDGQMTTNVLIRDRVPHHGIRTVWVGSLPRPLQQRWDDGEVVRIRYQPPWFTEEEILQAVEGVEE